MDASRLNWLAASDAARALREGTISAEQLTEACLARVREVDGEVQAWTFLDPQHALVQARARDADRSEGRPAGPLHGIPVGIKDIIDTADMPTEDGSVLHAGRTPAHDATVVALLRAAGAVIMGKTVTTEFATYRPGKTCNPHNPEHTPGGSSSGSAAAVAAGMVPLALGSQTNGSVIRPAAFCGVYGFKPTRGLIPRGGVLKLSRTLDQMGVFARTLEDVALIAEQLVGYDLRDPDTRPRARVPFIQAATEEPPLPPLIAYVKGPVWDRATGETQEAFAELVSALGERVVAIELPESAGQALDWHRTIMEAEMAANLDLEWEKGRDRLSQSLRAQLDRGREVKALDYQRACARIPLINDGFEEIFERCDAIVTPAAPGTAPKGLEATGDPAFCTLWTLCGMPSLSLPLMQGENGLPMGVQLVGRRDADARLLRTARWLVSQVETD
jgi:Asp-tRNA(Asn)/Glu-tRNA(Gln) amidotransferase A subunit family amidase